MSSNQIFLIWVLLILWLITCTLLVVYIRKYTKQNSRKSIVSTDLISALISQSKLQAEYAWNILLQVTQILGIGLIAKRKETISQQDIILINSIASSIIKDGTLNIDQIFKDLPNASSKCLFTKDKALQIRRLQLANTDMILIEDVSSTFEIAKRLKEAERLSILGKMSAHVAHQLKTPLAILSAKAQLLARSLIDKKELRKRAQEIFKDSRELAQRINAIVSMYKQDKPCFREINLTDTLNNTVERLKKEINKNRNIQIIIKCVSDIFIFSDPNVLEDILFLLGQNAIDEQVGASKVIFEAEKKNNYATIKVIDNGKGIPHSIRDSLFDPFVGKSQDGLGLGLFLAKDLAMRLDGSLELLDSENGTIFCLNIPLSSKYSCSFSKSEEHKHYNYKSQKGTGEYCNSTS